MSLSSQDAGFVYLLTGPSHGVRLVVSLRSLRRHYAGRIVVYTTQPASHEIGARCALDNRLGVEHRQCEQVAVRKNSSFLTKVALLQDVPFSVGAYLDCDTLVVGNPSALHERAIERSFCATQFAHWVTSGRTLRKRLERWRHLRQNSWDPSRFANMVDTALANHPAVNGGVFGFRRDAELLPRWFELSMLGRRTFICDEIALQLLLPESEHALLDCRYNCSPVYARTTPDVRIWHFHGEKHLRKPQGRALWLPAYQECFADNIAGLRDWALATDQDLTKYGDHSVAL